MARHESDREDLLREATALVERIELSPVHEPQGEHVVAGFRRGGACSIFFGDHSVYQFNAQGELRRAYCDGLLVKADRGRLVSLRRVRAHDEVQLLRNDLTDDEQAAFLGRMNEILRDFEAQLNRGQYRVSGQVPADANVLDRVRTWLAHRQRPTIAASPRLQ
jgi:hypothetical protein